jgi:hypothetical protein
MKPFTKLHKFDSSYATIRHRNSAGFADEWSLAISKNFVVGVTEKVLCKKFYYVTEKAVCKVLVPVQRRLAYAIRSTAGSEG